MSVAGSPPSWSNWRQALDVVRHPPHLRKTVRVMLVVGTILFCINQLDLVVTGRATTSVWLKSALTYLVPFCVANWGILIATRRRPGEGGPRD